MLKIFFVCFFFVTNSFADVGENITKCAKNFIGTPYDTNPIGEYVAKQVIIHDKTMDCMYFVFRCTELALANFDAKKAQTFALNLRFKNVGIVNLEGKVLNYENRFDYAEDMVLSEKWGKNVTKEMGKISQIEGSRNIEKFDYVKNADINFSALQNGDIIFWVKAKRKRIAREIIGHLGFVEIENGQVYFIHASGVKNSKKKSQGVVKILLKDYIENTNFIGIAVKRVWLL